MKVEEAEIKRLSNLGHVLLATQSWQIVGSNSLLQILLLSGQVRFRCQGDCFESLKECVSSLDRDWSEIGLCSMELRGTGGAKWPS